MRPAGLDCLARPRGCLIFELSCFLWLGSKRHVVVYVHPGFQSAS